MYHNKSIETILEAWNVECPTMQDVLSWIQEELHCISVTLVKSGRAWLRQPETLYMNAVIFDTIRELLGPLIDSGTKSFEWNFREKTRPSLIIAPIPLSNGSKLALILETTTRYYKRFLNNLSQALAKKMLVDDIRGI